MNWLAHLLLARHDDDALLGALLGDFVRGRDGLDRWGATAQVEILLHRRIDVFTDAHPQVTALRHAFGEGRRLYAGIVLDVYFDHLLASEWSRWSDVPLDAFTARVYAMLQRRVGAVPAALQAIVPGMAANDWLGSYRHRASVDRAVTRIAHRLSRRGDRLVACLRDLPRIESQAARVFPDVFDDLVAFAASQRADIEASIA